MGFFTSKPKPTIFEVLGIDKNYPDDTFVIDLTEKDEMKTYYRKLNFENKYIGIFSQLTVLCFKDNNRKNFILSCYGYEFNKYDLAPIIDKIYSIYGKDDSGKGLYTREDSEEIDADTWLGRYWHGEKYSNDCMINFNEEDGCSMTIWE